MVTVDLQSDSIVFTTEGKVRAQSVRREDTVISVPPGSGFKKVSNVYVDPETGKLIVVHEK